MNAVIGQRRDPWLAEQRRKADIEQHLFDPEGNPLLGAQVVASVTAVDEPLLRQFFDQHLSQFDWRTAHFRHILCKTAAEATAVKAQLDDGAGFAALAKERSIDANSYLNSGDLGWKGRGELPAEYEYVVFALKEGEISPPTRSFLGWHIAQILEINGVPDFDTMKDERLISGTKSSQSITLGLPNSVAGRRLKTHYRAVAGHLIHKAVPAMAMVTPREALVLL